MDFILGTEWSPKVYNFISTCNRKVNVDALHLLYKVIVNIANFNIIILFSRLIIRHLQRWERRSARGRKTAEETKKKKEVRKGILLCFNSFPWGVEGPFPVLLMKGERSTTGRGEEEGAWVKKEWGWKGNGKEHIWHEWILISRRKI